MTTTRAKSANPQQSAASNALSAAAARVVEPVVNAAETFFQQQSKSAGQSYAQFTSTAKKNLQEATQTVTNSFEEISQIQRSALESVLQATNTLAKSAEEIGKIAVALSQSLFESNVAAAKQLLSVRNAQEAFDIHTSLAKDNFDQIVSKGTQVSQLSLEATNKAFQPLQNQFNQAVESVIKKAA
ncbi:MAG: phasin family protein [Holosporales bacterium]|jgi:phasin family protein